MARKRLNLAYISDAREREETFKHRKNILMKKLDELNKLCGVDACAVIYDPSDSNPEVWSSDSGVINLMEKFEMLSETEKKYRSLNHEGFLNQDIAKVHKKVQKLTEENKENYLKELMFGCLSGNLRGFNMSDINDRIDLCNYIDQYLKHLVHHQNVTQNNPHFEIGESSLMVTVADTSPTSMAANMAPSGMTSAMAPTDMAADMAPNAMDADMAPYAMIADMVPTAITANMVPTDMAAARAPTVMALANAPTDMAPNMAPTAMTGFMPPTTMTPNMTPTVRTGIMAPNARVAVMTLTARTAVMAPTAMNAVMASTARTAVMAPTTMAKEGSSSFLNPPIFNYPQLNDLESIISSYNGPYHVDSLATNYLNPPIINTPQVTNEFQSIISSNLSRDHDNYLASNNLLPNKEVYIPIINDQDEIYAPYQNQNQQFVEEMLKLGEQTGFPWMEYNNDGNNHQF